MSASVLGLDLSLTATGIAHPNGSYATVKLASNLGDRRLTIITDRITDIILHEPDRLDLAVIEDLPTHAHGAGLTGMVHGAVRAALQRLNVPYLLVTPATLKKYATGKGNCGKPDMAVALYKRAGLELADDNQVDAAWLRFLGLDLLGTPAVEVPASHRVALNKLTLPPRSTAA